jgi:TolA-binding protein
MLRKRLQVEFVLTCVLGIACAIAGCNSVPKAPANAQNNATQQSLPSASSATAATPSSTYPVVTASATAPVATLPDGTTATTLSDVGPLVAGPSSPTRHSPRDSTPSGSDVLLTSTDTNTAGPPPSIPAELPSAPVSIKDAKPEEKKTGFEWSDLEPENVWKKMRAATGHGPDEKIARATMQEGQVLFRDKKYVEAAEKFATVADRWPDSPLEEDAWFLQGESEFFSDQYSKAHDTYGGLLKKYTNTRHLDTVAAREFAIGRYWEQLEGVKPTWPVTPNFTDKSRPMFDTFGFAVQAYERVRMYDPTGPLADASVLALANAYFRRGQFENAAYNYDLLRKEYPNSKYQMSAHVLGLQANMRLYQGTTYPIGPLNNAKKIADQTLNQYGDKLGKERDRIALARARIIEEKANREYILAKYYEQHDYFGAARMYYQGVIDEYPTTEKAKEAKVRLDAIKGKPDVPPSRLAWLTGMFGAKKQ